MKWSQTLIPTLKENPADAELISHKLMVRAGIIRKLSSGIYSLLPLGFKILQKIEKIIREEMEYAGASELLLPILSPSELWKESGRWDVYGKELIRIKDRQNREFALGPTHEEIITDLVRKEIKTYKKLPINLYQIQIKFRDEIRPRFGVMRAKEFMMKDGYSFDRDEANAERTYKKMYDGYYKIFSRLGLKFKAVEADTGAIGGSFSHEFMVLADSGEEVIVSCSKCEYAANLEKASGKNSDVTSKTGKTENLQKINTPNIKTVEELTKFLNCSAKNLVKTIICKADKEYIAALVRGDYEININKLKNILGCCELTMAQAEDIRKLTNAPIGFAGPVGFKNIKIIADESVKNMSNFITGSNEADTHLMNVNINRDFKIDLIGDIRLVKESDLCDLCGEKLVFTRGIEVGHVFKLGTKYSKALNATYLDEQGKDQIMVMGCYGIGVTRIIAASIEQQYDENGIIWPVSIAPYQILITPLNVKDDEIKTTADTIYNILSKEKFDILFDDRDETAGVKLKDADLIGIPLRITIGSKTLKEGKVELYVRKSKEVYKISKEEIVPKIKELISSI
ncbi:MAG: proline--tRNA ligase [Candidatus Firestonebacteria bacterium]